MKIAFVADPLSSFKIHKDSTYAMMVEAAKRGHELHFMLQEGLMWKGGRVVGEISRLTLTGEKDPWYRTAPPKATPLADFDAVLMRKDPPFDAEYVDRKSTRLNSSHSQISYAVFCLKKKKNKKSRHTLVNKARAIYGDK